MRKEQTCKILIFTKCMHTTKISQLSKRNNMKLLSQMSEYMITVIFRDVFYGPNEWFTELVHHKKNQP